MARRKNSAEISTAFYSLALVERMWYLLPSFGWDSVTPYVHFLHDTTKKPLLEKFELEVNVYIKASRWNVQYIPRYKFINHPVFICTVVRIWPFRYSLQIRHSEFFFRCRMPEFIFRDRYAPDLLPCIPARESQRSLSPVTPRNIRRFV